MLARSQGPRLDPNQENPHRQPHKTPARPALAGKNATTAGPAPVTGGKGVLGQTARTGRVLGAKDRNQGKHGNAPEPAALLFTGKPSTSTSSNAEAGPSCQPLQLQQPPQAFKTPLPNRSLRPVQDFKTHATALRPKHAPSMLVGSPDVSMEAEVENEQNEPEEEEDREVEYAGGSSRDYDEPYIPDWDEPDYKTAGFGEAALSMPLVPQIDLDEWFKEDEIARKAFKAELDPEIEKPLALREDDSPQPIFPLPRRRQPLGVKSNNGSTPSTGAPAARPGWAVRPVAGGSSLGKGPASTRRPLAPSTTSSAARRPPTTVPASSSSLRPGMTSRPPASSATAKPALPSSTLRKPLAPSSRPATTSTLTRPRAPPPKPLLFSRPSSSASASSPALRTPTTPAQRKAEQNELERELGAFGIVEDEAGLELLGASEGLGARGFADEEGGEFRLELELEL
ncbi:hypothetical protein JCM10049v2_004788 [Rhodotorula toruloides]